MFVRLRAMVQGAVRHMGVPSLSEHRSRQRQHGVAVEAGTAGGAAGAERRRAAGLGRSLQVPSQLLFPSLAG